MLRHRYVLPSALLAACAALLVFVATASAETLAGESSSPEYGVNAPSPEADLTHGTASYDTGGSVTFTLTTVAPPLEELAGKPNEISIEAVLVRTDRECVSLTSLAVVAPPYTLFSSAYSSPEVAAGIVATKAEPFDATKTISGATTTLSATSDKLTNMGFNCAVIILADHNEGGSGGSAMVFPVAGPPPPLAALPPAGPAPSAPAPAKLAIVKHKPVKLTAGKWKTVKLKVKNVGTTDLAKGSLRVKPVQGIVLRPEKQRVPALAAGASWTLSVRVQATERAQKKSSLALTLSGSGAITAKSSLVVKLKS